MKNKTKIILVSIALTVLGIVFLNIIKNFLLSYYVNFDDLKQSEEIFSLLNTILGGLFSGLVAYGVAAYQINKQQKLLDDDRLSASRNNLQLVSIEISDNISTCDTIDVNSGNFDRLLLMFKLGVSSGIWKTVLRTMEVDVNLAAELNSYYKDIDIIKNINNSESFITEEEGKGILEKFKEDQLNTQKLILDYLKKIS